MAYLPGQSTHLDAEYGPSFNTVRSIQASLDDLSRRRSPALRIPSKRG
jgi:hypothetical protein